MALLENRKDLQSFLGLVNYVARYSGRFASITAPLPDLTKKDTAYIWEPEHHDAFQEVKEEITSMWVLRNFDPSVETVIQTQRFPETSRSFPATARRTGMLCLESTHRYREKLQQY